MAPFVQRAARPPHLRCGGARHGWTGGRDGTVPTCHAAMVHVIISGRHLRRTVCPPAICRRQLVHSHWQPGAPCCGFVGSPLSRARGCVHAVSLSVMSFRMFYVAEDCGKPSRGSQFSRGALPGTCARASRSSHPRQTTRTGTRAHQNLHPLQRVPSSTCTNYLHDRREDQKVESDAESSQERQNYESHLIVSACQMRSHSEELA